ncbi:MAG: DNA repair protein RecO C-terminal domain-containing protein [Muribaculaceae bacterium]|nr:DNA repair protein RecO C-terminal domain-containing protein [Muribaculaceae bacterium]
MYTHVDCISLRTTRLSDSRNLLSVWERKLGRLTFAMPSGNTREARRRRALTAPLMIFHGEADLAPTRDIHPVRDISGDASSLASMTPAKTMTAMFVAETLDLLLRRAEADAALSDFLFGSVEALTAVETGAATANFHLIFLYRLTHFLGIGPQEDSDGRYFDMREGRFHTTRAMHTDCLDETESDFMRALGRANYRSGACLPLDRDSRERALDRILRYYALHLTPLTSLKSLDVLRMLHT